MRYALIGTNMWGKACSRSWKHPASWSRVCAFAIPTQPCGRAWLLSHSESPRRLKHPTEPDGPRWEDVLAFDKALHRSQNWIVYGLGPNPLDDVDERFAQFVEHPSPETFVPHEDFRVDVSNDKEERLFTDNCDDRYSTWQLLLAAEQVDAGIYLRMNLDTQIGTRRSPHGTSIHTPLERPVHRRR